MGGVVARSSCKQYRLYRYEANHDERVRSPYSLRDDFGYFKSQLSSLQILIPQLLKTKLSDLGPDFRVLLFFFQGASDPYCRPALVRAYFDKINAPRKEFVSFDQSGNMA